MFRHFSPRMLFTLFSCVLIPTLLGCSQGNDPLEIPKLDVPATASKFIQDLDSDSNQMVSRKEAEKSPGIYKSFSEYDFNGDGSIDEREFQKRLEQWQASEIAISTLACQIKRNGTPLENAKVVFTPEPWFGDAIACAEGETNHEGFVLPTIAEADLPATLQGVRGAHFGIYRVQVFPAGSSTPLTPRSPSSSGQEFAPDSYSQLVLEF